MNPPIISQRERRRPWIVEFLACAAKLISGQERVHRSGAEALQVERDELEAESFEDGGELRRDGGVQSTVQFLAGDLDADDVAVMAYAELAKAERANGIFATFDYVERLARHGAAIFDA